MTVIVETADTRRYDGGEAPCSAGRILDENGLLLATVVFAPRPFDGRFLYVERVDRGGGNLLRHRFGDGRHNVILEWNGRQRAARLATRWLQNHREWRIDLLGQPETLEPTPRDDASEDRTLRNA